MKSSLRVWSVSVLTFCPPSVYLVIHPDEGVHILDVSLPGLLHHFGQHGLAHPLPVDWPVRADEGCYSLHTSCVGWESQSDECRDHYSRSAHSIQLQPEKILKFEDYYFIMTIWSASHHQHVVVVGDEGKSLTFLHKHLVEIIRRFSDGQYREEFLVDIPGCHQDYKYSVWNSVPNLLPDQTDLVLLGLLQFNPAHVEARPVVSEQSATQLRCFLQYYAPRSPSSSLRRVGETRSAEKEDFRIWLTSCEHWALSSAPACHWLHNEQPVVNATSISWINKNSSVVGKKRS